MTAELPGLPAPQKTVSVYVEYGPQEREPIEDYYTADQMHAYYRKGYADGAEDVLARRRGMGDTIPTALRAASVAYGRGEVEALVAKWRAEADNAQRFLPTRYAYGNCARELEAAIDAMQEGKPHE